MKAITYILIITMIFNMFFTRGETVLWRWKALVITLEGIRNAAFMASRLIMLVVGCSIMTFTTMPSNLTDGLESVMHPLKYIKVPVHEIAMMMSIALRFIPILMEETDKIMKAQLARGADFENGNIVKRVKNYIPVLVPLFVASFRRANELTLAMESRCYRGGENRTRMKPLKYHKRDAVAYITMFAYLGIIIFLAIYLSPKDSTDAAALAGSINMQ
jgi:energy-coupling factor transport system permease protein